MERKTSVLFFSVGVLLCHTAALVPPVANVTLVCHNFQNTLHWDYSHGDLLKPQFKVHVSRNGVPHTSLEVDYPDLQCNLSAFISPNDEYRVQVTALDGLNGSAPAPPAGLTYSYFYASLAKIKCSLDLPPINVTTQSEAEVKFSFSHPSVLYRHKLGIRAKRRPKFGYTVVSGNETQYSFVCQTDVCEESIPVAAGQESYCVKVHGYWEKVVVRSLKEYCSPGRLSFSTSTSTTIYQQPLYIGLGVISSLVLLTLLLAFSYKRMCAVSPTPLSLNFSQTEPDSHSNTPLITDRPSISPAVSPVTLVSVTPTALNEPSDGTPELTGSVPWAPRPPPAPDAREAGPRPADEGGLGEGAREAEPGAVAAEGAREAEPGAENAWGYEQRDRLVTAIAITPGDMIDAYHS